MCTICRCKSSAFSEAPWPVYLPCARVHISENTTFQMTNPPLILAALAREESAREEHRAHPPSERSTNPPRASVMSERLDEKKNPALFLSPPARGEAGAERSLRRYGDSVRETRGQDSTISADGGTECSARASRAPRHEPTTRQHVGAAF